MTTATMRLIETVERLNMTGEIGDGTVARLHELAGLARLEQNPADVLQAHAERNGRTVPGYEALRAAVAELVPAHMRLSPVEASAAYGEMFGVARNPACFRSDPSELAMAEKGCESCRVVHACLDI